MKELEKRPSFQGRYALFVAIDLSDRIAHNRPDNPLVIGPNLQRGFRLVALENRPDITIGIPGPGFLTLPWPARPQLPDLFQCIARADTFIDRKACCSSFKASAAFFVVLPVRAGDFPLALELLRQFKVPRNGASCD